MCVFGGRGGVGVWGETGRKMAEDGVREEGGEEKGREMDWVR